MTTLDGRSWELKIGELSYSSVSKFGSPGPTSLQVEFSIDRDKSASPNTAEFVVYNLSPEHQDLLGSDEQTLLFSAGYQDSQETLFLGIVERARTEKVDGTYKTRLQAGDGTSKIVESRVSKSFARGTLVAEVVRTLVKSLQIGEGNLPILAPTLALTSGSLLPHALTLHGSAATGLTEICNSLGCSWSIQNGVFQIQKNGVPVGLGPLVTPDTGLIGSPQSEPKNVVTFQTLLVPGIFPGQYVFLKSAKRSGTVEVTQTRHYGATLGPQWQIDVKGVMQ